MSKIIVSIKSLTTCALLGILTTGSANAETGAAGSNTPMKASAEEGLMTFTSDDGQFSWWLDSRIQIDAAGYFGSDNPMSNGIEARRLRFALKGILWRDWRVEMDYDFADNEVDTKDAWLAYEGFGRNNQLKIGNFKVPFSLEEVTSSRMITFMERALPNVFAPGRRLGIGYTHWEDNWRLSANVFGQELGAGDESEEDEAFGLAVRGNFIPYRTNNALWTVGASLATYTPDADSDDEIRFRTRSETHVERDRYLNTGKVGNVDSVNLYGLETAYQLGSLMLQSEYIRSELNRNAGEQNAVYDGWYVFASYILTGERRAYNSTDGEFDVFTPNSSSGAWEIAVRASSLDLNDIGAGVAGGSADEYTVGVNFYPNRTLRLMLNYSVVDQDANADGDGDFLGDDSYQILQGRVQVVF